MRHRLRACVLLGLAMLAPGCLWWGSYPNPADAAVAAAEEDFGCGHVQARLVTGPRSSRSCSAAAYVVEGCGSIATYQCTSSDGACDYTCTAVDGPREVRGN